MREPLDKSRLLELLKEFGRELKEEGDIYLTGGASALLEDWRETTIDLDLSSQPEPRGFYEAIAKVKISLNANIELAAPSHFAPALPDWDKRSSFIQTFGKAHYYHYDFYSQALVKVIRNHVRDRQDVSNMLKSKRVKIDSLLSLVSRVEQDFLKYPRLDYERVIEKIKAWQ